LFFAIKCLGLQPFKLGKSALVTYSSEYRMKAEKDARLFLLLGILGIFIRYLMPLAGHNFDLETVFKIARLPLGSNYYQDVPIWANWGPICYWFFQLFYRLPGGDSINGFHYYATGLMTLADWTTAWVLWRIFGLRIAMIFFLLSPAAMVISGFHCNCEPLLLALAALGYWFYVKSNKDARSDAPFPTSTLVLTGASLAVKHVFAFLPIWMILRPMTWRERFRILFICFGVWVLFLSPYLLSDPGAVIRNIFLYSSNSGGSAIPKLIAWSATQIGFTDAALTLRPIWFPLFLFMLLGVGWLLRNRPWKTAFLFYPISLVSTSSAIALQYIAPACFSLAALPRPRWVLRYLIIPFHVFCFWYYLGHWSELGLWGIGSWLLDHFDRTLQLYWSPGVNLLQLTLLVILTQQLRVMRNSHVSKLS